MNHKRFRLGAISLAGLLLLLGARPSNGDDNSSAGLSVQAPLLTIASFSSEVIPSIDVASDGHISVGLVDDRVLQATLIGGVIGAVFGKDMFTLRRNY